MRINKFSIFFICFFFCVFNSQAQFINPVPAFSFTNTSFVHKGRLSAIAVDTISQKLYFQNNCNCGIGASNIWSMLSYVNLATGNIFTPYTLYGPSGTDPQPKEMYFSNNRIQLAAAERACGVNLPGYNVSWTFTPNVNIGDSIVSTAKRNDSLFLAVKENMFGCNSIKLVNAINGTQIPFGFYDCQFMSLYSIQGEVKSMLLKDSLLYVAGSFILYDQFNNGIDTNAIAINIKTGHPVPLFLGINDTIYDLKMYRNAIHLAGSFTLAKGQSRNKFASFGFTGNLLPGTPVFNNTVKKIEFYDDYLFALGVYSTINSVNVNPSGNYVLKAINLKTNSIMNWSLPFNQTPLPDDDFILKIAQNKLYMVSRKFGGDFIKAFCLPPIKSTTLISVPSSTVCDGSTIAASIPQYRYATGYNWHYSGTGVSLTPNSNSVTINFALGATSGKLKVVGVNSCGSSNDTVSFNITVYPRPGATATLIDDTLNCFKPKVPILGNSPASAVNYQWKGPGTFLSNQQNDSTGTYLPGTYSLTVTKIATGCTSNAYLNFKLDTLKPQVALPPPPYIIPCPPNYLTLNGTSTTTPSQITWKNKLSSTIYSNPFTPTITGTYLMIVQDLYNGCFNYDTLSTTLSNATPTVFITSYPTYTNFMVPADTINCITPSLSINAVASPTNSTIQWKEKATGNLFSNPITVTSQGNYFPVVTRLDNSCTDSSKIILIAQDVFPPLISILSASPNINCSYSTATLNAVSSSSLINTMWTGPGSFSSANPAVTSVIGWYYFHANNPVNGCVNKDSVQVGYTNQLVVNCGKDTTVCKLANVNLTAAVVGTVSSLNYQWSTGALSQNTVVSPSVSTTYYVQVNGGGCNGADTVKINIPADLQDSIVTAKGCTGNSGNIVVYAKGGIPPYKYSLNGSAYSAVNTFSNLAFATYTISIKDSIGCIRNNTATINNSSNSIQPVFIASTKNFKGDTVVLVDITQPKADSLQWILPALCTRIGGEMFSPVVLFSDTGSFPVTMKAFYGNCMISSTKVIQIFPFDTAYATIVNNNGIKSLTLFPNPNTGQFTIQVEFYKKQNVVVQVWDSTPFKHFQQAFDSTLQIIIPVNLYSLANGTYLLKIIGEYASKNSVFIINK